LLAPALDELAAARDRRKFTLLKTGQPLASLPLGQFSFCDCRLRGANDDNDDVLRAGHDLCARAPRMWWRLGALASAS
jgi:hypothetical protein